MEKDNYLQALGVPALLLILLLAYCDPFMVLMPEGLVTVSLGVLVLLYTLFALYVWREHSHDERERYHKLYASRLAFLGGSAVLVMAVLHQVFYLHSVDPWILFTLAVMVVAKAGGAVYSACSK